MESGVGYKRLCLYQKSHALVLKVYEAAKMFPKEEMRRCAVSVVANIVEGYGRKTTNDKIQFYHIARGSLTELEYYIDLARALGYFTDKEKQYLSFLREETGRLLHGFMSSLR